MNKKPVQNNEINLDNKAENSNKDFINNLKHILCEDNIQCKEVRPDKKKIINLYTMKRNKDASTTISRTAFREIFRDCFGELAEVFKSYVAAKKVDESCTCKLDRGIPARPHRYNVNYISVSNKGIDEQQWNKVRNTLTQYSVQNIPQHDITPETVDAAIQLSYLGKKDQITECKESHNKCYFNIDSSSNIIRNLEDADSIEELLTKNTRLRSAVKKLTLIRQKEKQNSPWRGFIHELRRKHNQCAEMYPFCTCYNSEDRNIFSNEKLNTSSSYVDLKKLVKDVYDDLPRTNHTGARDNTDSLLDSGRYFSPNLSREYNVLYKCNREKPISVDDHIEAAEKFGRRNVNTRLKYNYNYHNKSAKEKVPFTNSDLREYDEKIENAKRKLNNTIVKCDKLRADIKPKKKPNTLTNIETKLDHLIKSIDNFILEVRSSKNAEVCKLEINKNNCSRSEFNALTDFEEALCGHYSTFSLPKKAANSEQHCPEKYKTIVDNPINNDHKKDIRSSTNITFRLVTNQRSAETSTSLIAAPLSHGDDKSALSDKAKRQRDCYKHLVNIAINTDPLGLFALLKISSQSIKQLLSSMPTLNYLPMLQYSDDKKVKDTDFNCKVCGACFPSPAELSKHILGHTLGAVRDCGVCRQVVQLNRYRGTRLFTCGHCGQTFTRAYCCQLHQQDCAKKLGRPTEDKDNLLILR